MALKDQYAVLKYSHLGLSFAIFLGGSFFLGLKADQKFGTGSVLTLLCGGLGTAAGFYYLLRQVSAVQRADGEAGGLEGKKDEEDAPPPTPPPSAMTKSPRSILAASTASTIRSSEAKFFDASPGGTTHVS